MKVDNRNLNVAHNTLESKDIKSMINNKVPNLSSNKKFYYKNKISKYIQLQKKPMISSDKNESKFASNLSSFAGASPSKKFFQKSKLTQKLTIDNEAGDIPKLKSNDKRKSSNFGTSTEYMIGWRQSVKDGNHQSRPKMSIKSRLLGCNSANKLRQSSNSELNLNSISTLKGKKLS